MDIVYFTIPNVITVGRLVAIPFVVFAIMREAWMTAFLLFVIAGASDGIDGFIARWFGQDSKLGTLLDPIADKALTIAVFASLVADEVLPFWLFALIVARDLAIVAGAGYLAMRGDVGRIRPLMISKINTAVLIVLAAWILAANAFGWSLPALKNGLIGLVVVLTAASAAAYGRHLALSVGPKNAKDG